MAAVAAPKAPALDLSGVSAAIRRAQTPASWRVPRYQGKPVLRRTWVENFLACGVWRDSSSEEAAFGSWWHEAASAYVRTCQAHGEESRLVDVERIARETFQRQPRGLHPGRLREGTQLLDQFARTWLAELQTLTRLEFTMAHDIGWAILTGQADREDRIDDDDRGDPPRVVRLTDYKTHWGVADHWFQMRFYAYLRFQEAIREAQALGLRECPLEEVQVRVLHPRLPWHEPIEDYYDLPTLEPWWRDEVVGPLTETWPRRRSLGPTGGSACQYCAKRLTCASAEGESAHAPESPEGFLLYFQEALRTDARLRELRAGIRMWFRDRVAMTAFGYEVGPLYPRSPEELAVVPGRDEDLIAYMNELSPGSGELIRRTGAHPALIAREWWQPLQDEGLVRIVDKPASIKWRKDVRKGIQRDEGTELGDEEALYQGPPDSLMTVLPGGRL